MLPARLRGRMASTSVFLNVNDITKSLEFYRALGFRALAVHQNRAGADAWADLDLDGAELGLGHIPSNDDPAFRAWCSTPLGAGVVVYMTVADVDAVYARATKIRATIEVPLEDRSYGRVFTLNDPDGYTLTFLEEPRPAPKRAKPKKTAKAKTAKRPAARKTKGGAAKKAKR